MMFVIGKMKLVSFSLFLDASPPPPPRPKMPFGQWYVAINIYNMCKGRLGSMGGKGVVQAKEYITHLIKIDHFSFLSLMVYFPYM